MRHETPALGLNAVLDTALQRLEEEDPRLKGCFVKGETRNKAQEYQDECERIEVERRFRVLF